MRPRFWVGTSWKMNKTIDQANAYARALLQSDVWDEGGLRSFVLPPFTALAAVARELEGSPIMVGAQTIHWADHGSYTGEVSAGMVADCGAQLVELGHSERRRWFGETDNNVNCKVKAALRHGLRPLVCVGETAEEKRFGVAAESVSRQVKIALHGVEAPHLSQVLIAYEPVWAIGDEGSPASADYVNTIHRIIRRVVTAMGSEGADIPILYGGGVAEQNGSELARQPDVDGLFIGRAAWEAAGFLRIVHSIASVLRS